MLLPVAGDKELNLEQALLAIVAHLGLVELTHETLDDTATAGLDVLARAREQALTRLLQARVDAHVLGRVRQLDEVSQLK